MIGKKAKPHVLALAFVLLLGLGLRIWNFPPRYEVRDGDETGYIYGGLLLWEGMTPGFKMSPAGIQTWISWTYCAGKSAANLLWKQDSDASIPALLRPFYAVEQTLFETYRDASTLKQITIALTILLSIGAILAAFQTGFRRAGVPGGLLSGGMTAVLPLCVQLSGMAKPYMAAWACAIIAHYFAAVRTGRLRWAGCAVFMGLAISSRIEMMLFVPVIFWEVWNEKEPEGFRPTAVRIALLMIGVTLLVSPWLMTNLIGNLRTIATVRFSGQGTLGALLRDFLRFEGLGLASLLIVAGLVASPAEKRRNNLLLLVLYGFLFLTMLRPSPYGLRHHGATVIAAIVISPLALASIRKAHAKAALILAAALLVIPAMNAVATIQSGRQEYVRDEATAWIEKNVPSGTRVYLCATFHDPLPTAESADYLWSQVTDAQAWRKKFEQGAGRFNISASRIPRVLSEENMIQERGNRRRWFILGGLSGNQAPRYDIKIISGGSPFDLTSKEAVAEFKRTGGVLIWRQSRMDDAEILKKELGTPAVSWTGQNEKAVSVFWTRISTDSH
jgi:hypothetical protein